MRWKLISKDRTRVPTQGTYKDWKELLAGEGHFQCVYCAIHEGCFGGTRNFHVEHYRPVSLFEELINDYMNLFYSCPICNVFKGNDWPNEPVVDHSVPSYPNPSEIDYCDLFEVSPVTGLVEGRYIAARYIVERLALNRSQLIMERRIAVMRDRLKAVAITRSMVEALMADGSAQALEYLGRLSLIQSELLSLQNRFNEIRPYRPDEVRRNGAN